MSTSGLSATSPRREIRALYVTSFPTKSYRRPVMAARALNLLGIHSIIVEGWRVVEAHKPARLVASLSRFFPTPLNWISRDVAYEAGTFKVTLSLSPSLCFNLNVVGAVGMRVAARDKPLVLDMQDFTIQDDHTIPLYDEQILKASAPDLVIFASESIRRLVESRYPKLLKRTAYIPFGIDLATFDRHYTAADPRFFRAHISARDKLLMVYTGAAYLWGNREGQGIELLLHAAKLVVNEVPNALLVIQGAAKPGSRVYAWIEAWIRRLGLEGRVVLLPPMEPYAPLRMSMLKTADVLLLPIGDVLGTYYASQQKLFEYMAASRPLAMVATPARLSVIDDKGAYITWNREPSDFAAVIVEASTDRAGAPARAAYARRLVELKYDWRWLVPQYAERIRQLLEN
jgi:glycosyltransferase involved in cell wall biosynthesis